MLKRPSSARIENALERYGRDLKLIISPSAKLWIFKISLIVSGKAANNDFIAEQHSQFLLQTK